MLNYNVEEVKANLKEIFNEFYEWGSLSDSQYLDYYAKGMEMKNSYLQKIFDGTNGRIVLDPKDFKDFMEEFSFEEMKSYVEDELYSDLRGLNISYNFIDTFKTSVCNTFDKIRVENKKVIMKDEFKMLPFHGQRLTKVLNSLVDMSALTAQNISSTKGVKEAISDIKNKIVGGEMASFASGANFDGRKIVLSIRPEDLFLISYGNSWRSCMHPDEGEYNNGTLGYMVGPDAFVGFTVMEKDLEEFGYLAPKVWRQMMFVSEVDHEEETVPVLLSQKGYPRLNNGLQNMISNATLSLLGWEGNAKINQIEENLTRFRWRNGSDCNEYGYVDAFNWNDAIRGLRSPVLFQAEEDKTILINAQSTFVCLECGSKDDPANCSGLCEECYYGSRSICPSCEERFDEDYGVRVLDTSGDIVYVCEYCGEETVWSTEEEENIWSEEAVYAIGSKGDSWVYTTKATYSDYAEEYILDSDAAWCETLDSYILQEDVVELPDGTTACIHDCFIWRVDGKYHEDTEDIDSDEWKEIFSQELPKILDEAWKMNELFKKYQGLGTSKKDCFEILKDYIFKCENREEELQLKTKIILDSLDFSWEPVEDSSFEFRLTGDNPVNKEFIDFLLTGEVKE